MLKNLIFVLFLLGLPALADNLHESRALARCYNQRAELFQFMSMIDHPDKTDPFESISLSLDGCCGVYQYERKIETSEDQKFLRELISRELDRLNKEIKEHLENLKNEDLSQ